MQLELVAFQRAGQSGREVQAPPGVVDLGDEDRGPLLVALGAVDGDLRVADELGGGGARLRQCDPDASAGADLEPGDGEGAAQGVMQRVGNVARLHVGAGAELAQQDEERVAGEPGDHPLRTDRVAQPDGDRGEQLVPRLVASR